MNAQTCCRAHWKGSDPHCTGANSVTRSRSHVKLVKVALPTPEKYQKQSGSKRANGPKKCPWNLCVDFKIHKRTTFSTHFTETCLTYCIILSVLKQRNRVASMPEGRNSQQEGICSGPELSVSALTPAQDPTAISFTRNGHDNCMILASTVTFFIEFEMLSVHRSVIQGCERVCRTLVL